MPRVSEEHLERRRQQIIDAAWQCFSRRGFYATSMQDILKEADLSAGAVYRYFRSKDEIIEAIARDSQAYAAAPLDQILAQEKLPPLPEIMGSFFENIALRLAPQGKLRIAPQAWAQAMHEDDLGAALRGLFEGLRSRWIEIATRLHQEGQLPEHADPAAVGAFLLCLMPGFLLQYLLLGDLEPATIQQALEGLMGTDPSVS